VCKKLSRGVLVQQVRVRLMDGTAPLAARCLAQASAADGLLLSEWWMRPGPGRCRWTALISADSASLVRMWSRIAQPTVFRLANCMTAAE
jgi:hypothetical protein